MGAIASTLTPIRGHQNSQTLIDQTITSAQKPPVSLLQEGISTMQTPPSPLGVLGTLPPELRTQIYKHALTSPHPIQINHYHHSLTQPDFLDPGRTKYKKTGKAVTRSTAEEEEGPQSRVLAHPHESKGKQKLPAAEIFAPGLLGTSKTIRHEATGILYGENCFEFATDSAIEAFTSAVGERAAQLTNVTFTAVGVPDMDRHITLLSRMAEPRHIRIMVFAIPGSPREAAAFAERIWESCQKIFTTRQCCAVPGWGWLEVPLPLKLQLERFAGVTFWVPEDVTFEGAREDRAELSVNDDEGERARRFREMVRERLVGEAESERKREEA